MPSVSQVALRRERSAELSLTERMRLTPVSAVMVHPVRCAKVTMTRAQIAQLMVRAEISAIPVVDDCGVIVGMISKTDVVREDYGDDVRWSGAVGQAGKFMTRFVLRLAPTDSVLHAVKGMSEAGVHHLVVADPAGHAVGMVSTMDIMHWLAREAADEGERDADDTLVT